MWSDNETTVDYLNFGIVADACSNLLQQTHGQPISIGVSGGWGAGKTSLVKMIESRLKSVTESKDNNYVFITFNPWLYQDFDSARSAILQLVGDKILHLVENRDIPLQKKARKLLKRINLLRLAQLGGDALGTLITGVPIGRIGRAILSIKDYLSSGISNDGVENVKSAVSESKSLLNPDGPVSLPNEIQAFRNALEELLDELKVTLVVFVDDLDRCLPKTAISTLESIRLLLFLNRSAFVIAADNDFIRSAVRVHFEGTNFSDDVATNYFDKLIQVPLHVPRLGVNETKAYLALLLMERAEQEGKISLVKFEQALNEIPKCLQRSWRGDTITTDFLHNLVGKDNKYMTELMVLAEGLAPLLVKSSAVNANPRLMKRFLNTVYLRSALAEPQGIRLDIPSLAKWHLLERCDESLANSLAVQVNSTDEGRVSVLHEAEIKAGNQESDLPDPFDSKKSFHREWLQLDPPLGESDLRPLLHLSRDTTTRDFGSDNMTEDGRELRDALVSATSSNEQLTETIRKAGRTQTELAMLSAWKLKESKRTWREQKDVLLLIEPCKVYPELGTKAAQLLSQAPVDKVGPGIIPTLYSCDWACSVLDKWQDSTSIKETTKKAIQQQKKKEK